MEIKKLFNYIKLEVPNLTDLEIVKSGLAYHYTMHSSDIEQMGRFLGRSIDEDLDRSQNHLESIKATDENGIVCAYPDIAHTLKEGKFGDCHIYEIHFSAAVSAFHQQEVQFAKSFGVEVPKTLFIPALNISTFKRLGRVSEIK